MNRKLDSLVILIIFLLCTNDLLSQPATDTSGSPAQPLKNTIDLYYRSIGDNNHLYNGSEYVSPVYRQDLSPYFKTVGMTNGYLMYDGTRYEDVPLLYDLMQQRVVTYRRDQHFRITLAPEKVAYFSILGHLFVRIEADSGHGSGIDAGYYDWLYDGRVRAYALRTKKLVENIVDNQPVTKMIEEEHYFIWKEGNYYSIYNKQSLLSAFKDKKKEIRKYLRKNGFRFRRDPENTMIQAADYYDRQMKAP